MRKTTKGNFVFGKRIFPATAVLTVIGVATTISILLAHHPQAAIVGNVVDIPSRMSTVYHGDCSTKIDGRVVELKLGESIEVAGVWRNCQSYDGHSLIVFSSRPPDAQDRSRGE